MSVRRYLIVNADDYARSSEVSAGILEAHRHGIVTTTTVLINMPGALQSLREGSQTCPTLGFGLHLNLSFGKPCRDSAAALVGQGGDFHPLQHWYDMPQDIPVASIKSEWKAQIERFLSSGLRIDHLDSHHHIAALRPELFQVYLELAEELRCGVRPPYPDDISQDDLHTTFPARMIETATNFALPALIQSAIPHPDTFLASFFDERARLNHLLDLLETLPSGVAEIMCHPGYTSAHLEETSSYARQRVVELAALTDAQTTQRINDRNINLVTYRQAWPKF